MLEIEREIYQNTRCEFDKLETFGFQKLENRYRYTSDILNGEFRAEVVVSDDGQVAGTLYDPFEDEEYTNFRIKNGGAYVSDVRDAYETLLREIRETCFTKLYYKANQTNEIVEYIIATYGDVPSFEWVKSPTTSVFRNSRNQEAYLHIVELGETQGEALYVRLPENRIKILLQQRGFYPSTFLSDKKWVMLRIEDALDSTEIKQLVDEAYAYVDQKSFWLVPANPKYYDIIGEFEKTDTTTWNQRVKVHVGDVIYLYMAAPISAILFQCEVIETDIPYTYEDDNLKISKVFRMKLLRKYDSQMLPLALLKKHGITWIRGQRRLSQEVVEDIQRIEHLMDADEGV